MASCHIIQDETWKRKIIHNFQYITGQQNYLYKYAFLQGNQLLKNYRNGLTMYLQTLTLSN